MSFQRPIKSKRVLPNVPLALERIERASSKASSSSLPRAFIAISTSSGSKTSTVSSKESSSAPSTPEKILIQKKSAPAGALQLNALKNSTLAAARRRLLEEQSDSNSSSTSSSPYNSPLRRGSIKENVPLTQDSIGENIKEQHGTKDRQIARVLPMSPAFLEGSYPSSTTPYQKDMKEIGEHLGKRDHTYLIDDYNTSKHAKAVTEEQFGTPRSLNVNSNSVPMSTSPGSTPYQMPNMDEGSCSITVAVRVRPLLAREKDDPNVKICLSMKENETSIISEQGIKYDFVYDHSLWSADPCHPKYVGQEKLYKLMGEPLLTSAFQGYNTCLFAYGQTGSGKSYSIMGQGEELGVLPRFCEELFDRINIWPEVSFTVEISYFEIYNEKIHDLLVSNKGKHKDYKKQLRVREHPILGPFVQDLSTYVVSCYADIESWLALGNRNRATAATGMNDKSSRSHSVFTIVMSQTKTEVFEGTEAQMTKTSKINLIDLAGSERASNVLSDQVINSAETASLRLKTCPYIEDGFRHNMVNLFYFTKMENEGGSINKSLHTLGKVISLLSDKELQKKKKMYIPYRDSFLTWLLKDSLGGNSKTAMIANVSPANSHFGETLSTLRYAQRARTIVNRAVINEDPNAKIIKELRAEIERLNSGGKVNEENSVALEEVSLLRGKLLETQRLLVESTRNWQEKLALSEKRKLEEAENLKKAGISFKVDNKLPNLVNLNEDPQLSEMLLYILKPGATTVGHQQEEDIQLSGALVAESHCIIKNEGEKVTVSPLGDAPTYVNGQLICEEADLHHGDRIVIGGDHFFRLNHPIEAKKRREQVRHGEVVEGSTPDVAVVKDFEYARNELAQVQNTRLQAELEEAREEARIQAQEEIMKQIQKEKEAANKTLMKQKFQYEQKTEELQSALNELNVKKEEAEKSSQSAADVISELQAHRQVLEQEILSNRKKLQMEALAAKQALEETKLNQIRIMSELEKEKKKMQEDVEKLKEAKKHREKMREEFRASFSALGRKASNMDDPSKKELLRTTMALREANKISQHLKKNITFSRDEVDVNGKTETKIRLNDTKKGLTTLWSLGKFEARLQLMRDCYQQEENEGHSGDDDPFMDPDDKWNTDFTMESPNNRRMSTLGALSLSTRRTTSSTATGKNQARAENIFAKYHNKQEPRSTSSDVSATSSPNTTPTGSACVSPAYPSSPALRRKSIQSSASSAPLVKPGRQPVSSLCAVILGKSLELLKENSNPFSDPVYERILTSAQRLKAAVSTVKSHYKDILERGCGATKEVQECCISATVVMETLIAQVQLWHCRIEGTKQEMFASLRDELMEIVKTLAAELVKILSSLDDASDPRPHTDELFKTCETGIRDVVKQTAKIAVLNMNDNEDISKISCNRDEDLDHAFIVGQEQSLQTSIRRSIDSLDSLQAQVENDVMRSDLNEVEKEITEEVLKLLRSTSDFVFQGRDLQTRLQSASKNLQQDRRGSGRLTYIARLVRGLDTVLDISRTLATTTPQACENMQLDTLLKYTEQISTTAKAVTKDCRALIESEYCNIGNDVESDILVEQEYFEKKAEDVEVTGSNLKRTLKRFMFLNTDSSRSRKEQFEVCGTPYSSRTRGLLTDEEKLALRKRWNQESPI